MAETLNTYTETEPTEEQKAHEQAMSDKVAQAGTAGRERTDWLPEKFNSVEDMAKAYGELEKKLSAPSTDTETKEQTTEETPAPETASHSEIETDLNKSGVDLYHPQTELTENGG